MKNEKMRKFEMRKILRILGNDTIIELWNKKMRKYGNDITRELENEILRK